MANYLSWEDLDEERPAIDLLAGVEVDDGLQQRVAALMQERARLEDHMNRLLGKAPPKPEDARKQALFPMPIHTAESRLEEKRQSRETERARAAARRALEATRLDKREERERIQQKRDLERAGIQRQLLVVEEKLRREARDDERRRALLGEALIRDRWAALRESTRLAREAARRQEWVLFEQRSLQGREAAMARCRSRDAESAEFEARLGRQRESLARRRLLQQELGLATSDTA